MSQSKPKVTPAYEESLKSVRYKRGVKACRVKWAAVSGILNPKPAGSCLNGWAWRPVQETVSAHITAGPR